MITCTLSTATASNPHPSHPLSLIPKEKQCFWILGKMKERIMQQCLSIRSYERRIELNSVNRLQRTYSTKLWDHMVSTKMQQIWWYTTLWFGIHRMPSCSSIFWLLLYQKLLTKNRMIDMGIDCQPVFSVKWIVSHMTTDSSPVHWHKLSAVMSYKMCCTYSSWHDSSRDGRVGSLNSQEAKRGKAKIYLTMSIIAYTFWKGGNKENLPHHIRVS